VGFPVLLLDRLAALVPFPQLSAICLRFSTGVASGSKPPAANVRELMKTRVHDDVQFCII
jgi:hypothetical protein